MPQDTSILIVHFDAFYFTERLIQLLLLLSNFSHVWPSDPIDGSPPGSSVPGILQARILQWVAISFSSACMHAKSLQSYPLCNPMDCGLPGSSVHRILKARILEWVAISFSSVLPNVHYMIMHTYLFTKIPHKWADGGSSPGGNTSGEEFGTMCPKSSKIQTFDPEFTS